MVVMIGEQGKERHVKGERDRAVTGKIKQAKSRRNQAVQIMVTAPAGGESWEGEPALG